MIILNFEQGTPEWNESRLGIPTASQASRIVTPTGKLSTQRDTYLAELLVEWALGESYIDFGGDEWVERGKMLEAEARKFYAFARDQEPTKVGFVYKDESRMCGASPDALVGNDGLLELKVPMPKNHLLWLIRDVMPKQHLPQVQFQLWVSGRSWCDFVSYCPNLPEFLIRVAPEDVWQETFDKHIPVFIDELLEGREKLLKMGVLPDMEPRNTGQVKEPNTENMWV